MPIVQVSVWEGMPLENKKKTVEGITKVFVDLGVPKEAVEIVIYEVPKSNWATGGVVHSERHATPPRYKQNSLSKKTLLEPHILLVDKLFRQKSKC
jgi:4-oxalocrotonate tautomerase